MNLSSSIQFFINSGFLIFQNKVGFSLTPLQKKVSVIALACLSCLTIGYLIYLCRFKASARPVPINKKENDIDLAISLLQVTSKPVPNIQDAFDDRTYLKKEIAEKIIDNNVSSRMKVVEALGGEEMCKRIPSFNFNFYPSAEMDSLDDPINLPNFPQGHAIIQGEDQIGRKVVLLRLKDRENGEIVTLRVFQRYLEKGRMHHPCNKWIAKDSKGYKDTYGIVSEKMFENLAIIVEGMHPKYVLHIQ